MFHRLHNSFAYRFNKLARSLEAPFIINLNKKELSVPLMGTLGEANIQVKDSWFGQLMTSLRLPAHTEFLDVGANVGQTLLLFRSLYDNNYWGFEPNPICNFYLEELIKVNQFKKVNILPIGLASQSSLVPFFMQHSHDTGATIVENYGQEYKQEEVRYVPVFSLDALQLKFTKISLIKIDVEGAELDVVSGMVETIRQHQPIIICEVLDYITLESKKVAQDRASQLMELFTQLGYSAHLIVHSGGTIHYNPITDICLKQHSEASYDLNDYLFLPAHIGSVNELN